MALEPSEIWAWAVLLAVSYVWPSALTWLSWPSPPSTVAMTLNIDPVYTSLDELLAGRNCVGLPANVSLVVGIYFLSRAIIRAATSDEKFGFEVPVSSV